jgi:hypothetical protein
LVTRLVADDREVFGTLLDRNASRCRVHHGLDAPFDALVDLLARGERRRKHRNASETAALLLASPWQTP